MHAPGAHHGGHGGESREGELGHEPHAGAEPERRKLEGVVRDRPWVWFGCDVVPFFGFGSWYPFS